MIGACVVREEESYRFAVMLKQMKCVRIREVEIHTAVLLESEEHSTSKQVYNGKADEENETAGERGRAEDDGKKSRI